MAGFDYRCPECRTRRRDYGLFTRHLRESGHKVCWCSGYHFAHRPGSPYCERNPMSPALLASRYGATDDEVVDIVVDLSFTTVGRVMRPSEAVPF